MSEIIVTVEQGPLRGKVVKHIKSGEYYSFQGIPYAKPPLGHLRFKDPLPPEPWNGIRDATEEGNCCYSKHMISHEFIGSEDCLVLNIYTPSLPSKNSTSKPVMVWIHGGGFVCGSGSKSFYGPDFLISEDIILVTLNFRIGILGFLSFNDVSLAVPGNAALKDVVAALKWLKKNIHLFNGDPNNVTIFGESAGSAMVHYLQISPMTSGLIHKAIMQSGVALNTWSRGQPSAPVVAKALQLETTNEADILKLLQSLTLQELLQVQEKVSKEYLGGVIQPWGPVVEKPNPNAFIQDDPLYLLKAGKYNKIPIMIGYTSKEGLLVEMDLDIIIGAIKCNKEMEMDIPHMLNISRGSDIEKSVADEIKNYYYNGKDFRLANKDQYYHFQTDNMFLREIYTTLRIQLDSSDSPIYLYRVSISFPFSIFKKSNKSNNSYSLGATHGEELNYLFTSAITPEIKDGSLLHITIQRFVKLWTTFARYGDLNARDGQNLNLVKLNPVEKGKFHYIDIGENVTVGINPDQQRIIFWDKIFKKYQQ